MFVVEKFKVTLKEKIQETDDIITFRFVREDAKQFFFKPGQFVTLMVDSMPDEFRKTRAYSICSAPGSPHIDLSIKIHEQGFTKVLSNLEVGSVQTLIGPFGDFVFEPERDKKVVFIAGGIGVTPFMSMIRFIASKNLQNEAVLFFSNRTISSIPFKAELDSIQKAHHNVRVVYVITREQVPGYECGRMTEATIFKYINNPSEFIFYSCGPQELIQGAEQMVLKLGVPLSQFRKEKW